jgi:hypothetical protein
VGTARGDHPCQETVLTVYELDMAGIKPYDIEDIYETRMTRRGKRHNYLRFIRFFCTFDQFMLKEFPDLHKTILMEKIPLTVRWQRHRIAPNMLKSARWFAFYFYYGTRTPVAVGGA